MIKETVTYVDYDGESRNEDFYFNYSRAELMRMNNTVPGGMAAYLNKIINERDVKKIQETFEEILLGAYGEKSLDGKRFVKSKEMSTAFSQTEAYSVLVMHMLEDSDYASKVINGMLPPMTEEEKNRVAALNAGN